MEEIFNCFFGQRKVEVLKPTSLAPSHRAECCPEESSICVVGQGHHKLLVYFELIGPFKIQLFSKPKWIPFTIPHHQHLPWFLPPDLQSGSQKYGPHCNVLFLWNGICHARFFSFGMVSAYYFRFKSGIKWHHNSRWQLEEWWGTGSYQMGQILK